VRQSSVGRSDFKVELVAFGVRHATPPEACEFPGSTRFEPTPAKRLDLGGCRVQVIDEEVEMETVLAELRVADSLKANDEPFLRWAQHDNLTITDCRVHLHTE